MSGTEFLRFYPAQCVEVSGHIHAPADLFTENEHLVGTGRVQDRVWTSWQRKQSVSFRTRTPDFQLIASHLSTGTGFGYVVG
jgi:hypothetical protein